MSMPLHIRKRWLLTEHRFLVRMSRLCDMIPVEGIRARLQSILMRKVVLNCIRRNILSILTSETIPTLSRGEGLLMKRWRVLCLALLLCGICLNGLCVPVSAADEQKMMLYNGVELPNIESVWTDKETYPYALINILVSKDKNMKFELICSAKELVMDNTAVNDLILHPPGVSSKIYICEEDSWEALSSSPVIYESYTRDELGSTSFSNGGNVYFLWVNYDLKQVSAVNDDGSPNYDILYDYVSSSEPFPVDSSFYRYNWLVYPALPEWDKETYPYAIIIRNQQFGTYLRVFDRPLLYNGNSFVFNTDGTETANQLYAKIPYYSWNEFTTSPNKTSKLGSNIDIWSNHDILNINDNTVYLAATAPVDPNAPTGTMEIISTLVLDDSACFVVSAAGLSSTESVYSFRYELYSGGALVSSHDHSEVFAGPSDMLHATIPNLSPQTEYEIVFSLLDNGVETGLSVSTTFTTLTGSGTGEGEGDGDSTTPDYSGQLGSIQSGIDNVQQGIGEVKNSVDGVGETLAETKEEITSLPQKIATALTDGIKGLFIPSQEDLTAIKEEYENMLSEKLGFIWQAFDLLTSFVGDLQTNLESGKAYEFTFPGVKLPMQGEEFVLVAETAVSLENDLMDVLRPVLGTIVSIVCVTAFVNMGHDYVLAIISGVSAYQFERRKE